MKKRLSIIFVVITISLLHLNVYSQTKKRDVKIIKTTGNIKFIKLDSLNSKYPELNLSISPDGKYLYFMSSRPNQYSTKNYTGVEDTYDGDIYYSINQNGVWSKPINLDRTINSPQGEDEPNISPDGQKVYFQSWRLGWEKNGGPYYEANLKGNLWSNPKGLNSGITQFFVKRSSDTISLATDGSTFSPDGKTFIFSFGHGYYNPMDIYITKKDENGKWSNPKKLEISTIYDERNPFLAADGKTLYFSSNGYKGFGKMDIYKTTINEDGSCGEVVNIGEPFNTKEDDQCFVLTANGNDLYFVRNGDIYYCDLKNIISELKPNPTIIFSGIVKDKQSKKYIESEVKLIDLENDEELGKSITNINTGAYSLVGALNKKYRLEVSSKGYVSESKEIVVPQELSSEKIVNDFELTKKELPPKEDIVKQEQTNENTEDQIAEPCVFKLDDKNFSIGLYPLYPYAIGIKTEVHRGNFGGIFVASYLPKVGRYDDIKPPDEYASDNYSTSIIVSLIYNIPLTCNFYPFIGLYNGYQFRNWKKEVYDNGKYIIKEGNYSGYHYGFSLGGKLFINDLIYFEGGCGLGRNGVHSIPSGDVIRYEWQLIPWVAFCYVIN